MTDQENIAILEATIQTAQIATLAAQSTLELLRQRQKADDENRWVSLSDAVAMLGSGISVEMLKDRCRDGRFRHGVHFINTSDGDRPNYLIRVASARKYFETEPPKRPLPKAARLVSA